MVDRVTVTPAAAEVVERLRSMHGALLFHQSGGCCDGSSPMCYPAGEFRVGAQDVYLGSIAGCEFYMGAAQFEYWRHTQAHHRRGARTRRRLFAGSARRRAIPDAKPLVH